MSIFSRRNAKSANPAPAKQLLTHPVAGEVTVLRSLRALRLSISVRATGTVRLTIPRGVSEQEALRFLNEKCDWIERARAKVRNRNPVQIIAPPFSTRNHTLRLDPCATRSIRTRVTSGTVTVSYPMELHYEASEVQTVVKQGIEEAWRIEAKAHLPERTTQLCRLTGFRCGEVTVRNSRTRWGSCSGNNDISFSLHLMKLPDRLIDYVILHELCHTRHKNHGPAFHALLDRVTGGEHARLRQELRTHSTRW